MSGQRDPIRWVKKGGHYHGYHPHNGVHAFTMTRSGASSLWALLVRSGHGRREDRGQVVGRGTYARCEEMAEEFLDKGGTAPAVAEPDVRDPDRPPCMDENHIPLYGILVPASQIARLRIIADHLAPLAPATMSLVKARQAAVQTAMNTVEIYYYQTRE